MKVKSSLKITKADAPLFANTLEVASTISTSSSFSIEAAVKDNTMQVEDLEKIQAYLNEKTGKTTNKNKMSGLYSYMKVWIEMNTLQSKLAACMDNFKQLVQNDVEEQWTDAVTGEISIQPFKELISNLIFFKKQQTNMQQ